MTTPNQMTITMLSAYHWSLRRSVVTS